MGNQLSLDKALFTVMYLFVIIKGFLCGEFKSDKFIVQNNMNLWGQPSWDSLLLGLSQKVKNFPEASLYKRKYGVKMAANI